MKKILITLSFASVVFLISCHNLGSSTSEEPGYKIPAGGETHEAATDEHHATEMHEDKMEAKDTLHSMDTTVPMK